MIAGQTYGSMLEPYFIVLKNQDPKKQGKKSPTASAHKGPSTQKAQYTNRKRSADQTATPAKKIIMTQEYDSSDY